MVEDFYANQNSIRIFCNSLIVKDSHEDTGISLQNSVLKQAKMVSIYQKTIQGTPKRKPQPTVPTPMPSLTDYSTSNRL